MLRNLNSIRRYMGAMGLSSRYSSRKVSTAMSMRKKYQTSDSESSSSINAKSDRFSGLLNSLSGTESSPASLSDYRIEAAKSLNSLTKMCGNFDSAMKENLADEGVPESVSFEFDYDINSGEAKITKISDEQYLSGVQSALNKSMKSISLETIAAGSKILNGKMAEAYYPTVSKALEKCFGQDISDLSVDKNGNILGMNRKLRAAVSYELTDTSFNAQSRYGFPSKELASVIKRVVSDRLAGSSVSHMSFTDGSLKTADGDISLGKKCAVPSLKKTSVILRAAAAGNPGSMDLWVKNEDLFCD